jgi:hypothetical protein
MPSSRSSKAGCRQMAKYSTRALKHSSVSAATMKAE